MATIVVTKIESLMQSRALRTADRRRREKIRRAARIAA
jgi:hypothetical protein